MNERYCGEAEAVYIGHLARDWGEHFAARAGADPIILGAEVLVVLDTFLAEAEDVGVDLGEVVDVNGKMVRRIVIPCKQQGAESGMQSLILHRLETGFNLPRVDGNPWNLLVKDRLGFRPAHSGDIALVIPDIFTGLAQAVSGQPAVSR